MAEFIKTPVRTYVDLALEDAAHDVILLEHALRAREQDYVEVRAAYLQAVETLAIETLQRRQFQRKYYALLHEQRGGAR